jgi:hypothetical protein
MTSDKKHGIAGTIASLMFGLMMCGSMAIVLPQMEDDSWAMLICVAAGVWGACHMVPAAFKLVMRK